jgi:hypothetical protein
MNEETKIQNVKRFKFNLVCVGFEDPTAVIQRGKLYSFTENVTTLVRNSASFFSIADGRERQ